MAVGRKAPLPSGRVALRRVSEGLKRGWPPGLTLLTGEDLYHLDRAQRLLLEALTEGDASGFGLTVWGEDRVPVERVVEAARAVGMFSPRRVVFVRDAGALEGEPDALLAYAARPAAGSFLVVRAPKLDARRKLHKALLEAGTALVFGPLSPEELLSETKEMARARSLVLEPQALAFLADASAGELNRLDAELEKLRSFVGPEGKPPIGLETVREVAIGGGVLTGWELANAVTVRDRRGAVQAARRLLAGARDPGEALRILGGLAYRARMLIQARAWVESGLSPYDAVQRTRAWPAEEIRLGVARYTLAELLAFPGRLLEADRTLKSRSLAPLAVLESLVEDLTGLAGSRGYQAS